MKMMGTDNYSNIPLNEHFEMMYIFFKFNLFYIDLMYIFF